MIRSSPSLRTMLPAGAVLLASLATARTLPRPVQVLAPALTALMATLLHKRRKASAQAALAACLTRAEAAEAANAELVKAAGQMRHDLRGILSPALLTADRLTMSQDPVVRRAGETMVATVDRAEERLRRDA